MRDPVPKSQPSIVTRADRQEGFFSFLIFAGAFLLLLVTAPSLETYLNRDAPGFQLCMATQVHHGKVPGIDLFAVYGPLVMYTSAFVMWLSGSLLGETFLCALGYALALSILYFLVARYSSKIFGLSAVCIGFLLLARFYKWYVWLFPMLQLLMLHFYFTSRPDRRKFWLITIGAVSGVSWLFRFDIATTGLVVSVVMVMIPEIFSPSRKISLMLKQLALVLVAFALTLLPWFGYLLIVLGPQAGVDYLWMLASGSTMVATGMAKPLPKIFQDSVLNPALLHAAAFPLLVVTYAACAVYGIWKEKTRNVDDRSRFMAATGLIGFSVFHQALHRKDAVHFLQVIPPAIIASHLIVSVFLEKLPVIHPKQVAGRLIRATGLASYLVYAIICGLGLTKWGRFDMAGFSFFPLARYAQLARPLEYGEEYPVIKAILEIRKRTKREESILVFPRRSQYYTLADRRMSGSLHTYSPGVFHSGPWQVRNMESIQRDMPALVVLTSPLSSSDVELYRRGREDHKYLEDFLRTHYTKIVYQNAGVALLSRPCVNDAYH